MRHGLFIPVLIPLALGIWPATPTDQQIAEWLTSDVPEARIHPRQMGERAWPTFQRFLSSPGTDPTVVASTIVAISGEPNAKPVFLPQIRSRLRDPHVNIQMSAIAAIGVMGDQSDCATLRDLLATSKEYGVRKDAIRSLGLLGTAQDAAFIQS